MRSATVCCSTTAAGIAVGRCASRIWESTTTRSLTPPELMEARARTRQLQRALSRMSDRYRVVVVLHDLEELDVRDIAGIVRCNALTVRSRLRDGRKQLRKLLLAEASQLPLGTPHELNPS